MTGQNSPPVAPVSNKPLHVKYSAPHVCQTLRQCLTGILPPSGGKPPYAIIGKGNSTLNVGVERLKVNARFVLLNSVGRCSLESYGTDSLYYRHLPKNVYNNSNDMYVTKLISKNYL